MRISGNEPLSVIPSQSKWFQKLKMSDCPKVPKQAEAKRNGVINPQNLNFNIFSYGKRSRATLQEVSLLPTVQSMPITSVCRSWPTQIVKGSLYAMIELLKMTDVS